MKTTTHRLPLLITASLVTQVVGLVGHPAHAQPTTLSAEDLTRRAIERRAIEAVIWGMPAVNYRLMYHEMVRKTQGGFNLDLSGMMPAAISPDLTVPGPWGHETAGLAAAVYDISGSGLPDLVIALIDNPDGENRILYKLGFDMDSNGMHASWSPQMQVGGWTGSASAGLGISVGDFRGNGRPDLAVFWIDDDPDGESSAYVRIGRDLDPTGFPLGGWAPERKIPGWWGTSTGGAGAAFANLRGLLRPDLVVLNLDAPENDDRAYYRVLSPPLSTWNVLRQRTSSIVTLAP
jgi:hypothetical protein